MEVQLSNTGKRQGPDMAEARRRVLGSELGACRVDREM
jgi:hypothetical protein